MALKGPNRPLTEGLGEMCLKDLVTHSTAICDSITAILPPHIAAYSGEGSIGLRYPPPPKKKPLYPPPPLNIILRDAPKSGGYSAIPCDTEKM